MIPATYTHPGVNAAMLALSRNRRKAFLATRAMVAAIFTDEPTYRAMARQRADYERVAAELTRRLSTGFYVPGATR